MVKKYGTPVSCVDLVDQRKRELAIGSEYGKVVEVMKSEYHFDVRYTPFDYHKECGHGRTANISKLVDGLMPEITGLAVQMRVPPDKISNIR